MRESKQVTDRLIPVMGLRKKQHYCAQCAICVHLMCKSVEHSGPTGRK